MLTVFVREGGSWSQQAYLKASNAGEGDNFGYDLAISDNTIVVGANREDSGATVIQHLGPSQDGDDNSAPNSGAAYVFWRSDGSWTQQAYLKASNAESNEPDDPIGDWFGGDVAIWGQAIVVGARGERSGATGVQHPGPSPGGDDDSAEDAGAAYVFVRDSGMWSQQSYLKARNAEAADGFGGSVAMTSDAIVIGAAQEDSDATSPSIHGPGPVVDDNDAEDSGAVYVY